MHVHSTTSAVTVALLAVSAGTVRVAEGQDLLKQENPPVGVPTGPKHTNRLIHATSPYLLQHAHNPVEWYEWGEAAFDKAKSEDKPIFLSVGYAACHWCHVMEHESFESDEVAAALNENFVSIKVDREERPDIDELYMAYTQALIRTAFDRYLPNKVVVHAADRLADTSMPLLKGKGRIDGRATAYVCEHYNCRLPVTNPEELAKQLEAK